MDNLEKLELPALKDCDVEPIITQILAPMNLPRNVLAAHTDITTVWNNFSSILPQVHPQYRDELLARMVIAVRVGLFSSAINEIWNLTVIALRNRIKKFGFPEAKSFLKRDFDETILKELKDHDLLDLCVKLGLLGEREYFFLIHCKEIRNNYSSAHPSEGGLLDGHELTNFINTCVKYVLSKDEEHVGINIHDFIVALKTRPLPDSELTVLADKIVKSFEIQKSGILVSLFGIFCDPTSDEFVRDNCIGLLRKTWDSYTERSISEILSIYSEYSLKDTKRRDFARDLFKNLGKIEVLPREDQYHIMFKAIKFLERAHNGLDNFYTEVPLAQNLLLLYKSLPESLYQLFVEVLTLCFIGNPYGTSRDALPSYKEMGSNFNAKQIDTLINLYKTDTFIRDRVRSITRCRNMFVELINLLPTRNISATALPEIDKIKAGTFR